MSSKEIDTKTKEFAINIINTVREPLLVLDHDLRVVFAGRSFYDVFKVPLEETVGRLVYDIGTKQWDLPKLRELLENVIPNRESFDDYEVEHEFPHIGKRAMLLNARRVPPPPEKIEMILLAIEDITDRKLADSAIRVATVVRDSNDAVMMQDLEGNITAWNKGAERIFGYSEQEALQMKTWQFAPPDKWEEQKEFNRHLFSGEKVSSFETQRLTKDGRVLDMWLTVTKLVDNTGKVVGISATERDITERKMVEKALRESENNFRSMSESMPQIVWATRPDGWNVYFNQKWVDYTGLTQEESRGAGWNKPFHPDDQKRAWDAWENATQRNGVYSVECRLRRADGAYHWFLIRGEPMRDSDGKIIKWFGTCTDIQDLKEVENRLNESKVLFEAVVENIPLMLFLKEPPDMRFVVFNRAGEELLGYERKDLIGKNNLDLFPPEQAANFMAKDKEVIDGELGYVDIPEELVTTAKKGVRVLHTQKICIKGAYNKTKYLLGISEDITEHKQADNKLRESEKQFRTIFDEAADGIAMTDPESKAFHMSNKAFSQMLGYSQEEIENLVVMDIIAEKDIPYVMDQLERQAKGEFSLSRNVPIKRKNGSVFHADINTTNVTIAGKTYLMGFFHDTSEHREIEDLKRMEKLKKDFISNMSHELRTPLNAVIGFSEILADQKYGSLNATQKDYLNDILESGKFLLSLINDILDLAKVESGTIKIEFSEFSLKELLEGSLTFIKEKALKHNIGLSLEIAKEVGNIRGDERKVKQIVYNLISNAIKFTPDGGKMGIKAEMNGSEVKVTVWDTGIGISQEDQKKLFIAFVRLESSLGKKYEGTGLGLSLAKDFVELHQGKIGVESEGMGKGSRFTFTLPTGVA